MFETLKHQLFHKRKQTFCTLCRLETELKQEKIAQRKELKQVAKKMEKLQVKKAKMLNRKVKTHGI